MENLAFYNSNQKVDLPSHDEALYGSSASDYYSLSVPWVVSGFGSIQTQLWTLLIILFVVFNLKNLPGVWHMRILNAFRFILRTQRPSVELKPSHIFQPLVTSSTAQLLETDFNLHKNNSTYFSDVDISRTHLACTLFAEGIAKMRGGTSAYTGGKHPHFGLALGAVSCSFHKEIKPYQDYDMWSKVLSWDEKWFYIVTHFVRKGTVTPESSSLYPEQEGADESHSLKSPLTSIPDPSERPDRAVFATALSKCVFKSGRKTVSPATMLDLSGLLSPGMDPSEAENVEIQRKHGLMAASALAEKNQKALEAEFSGIGGPVLGHHTDGTGFGGVVSTLLQLAKLKTTQAL
ncbi:Thioesterase superfamily member 6 [Geosmithia morbida]|uniref:Thioesterase superfamily member 6 n=1 Tax=Geosmithia morbida TaxID=1094350 RepID=A0A9P4YWD2_9HYPO|nr:Thioesterase superfamily member 6 [Geosmithia morbida]KAF4122936.1 Thioesterase superfamily member 6 [Geosmithia morbida]